MTDGPPAGERTAAQATAIGLPRPAAAWATRSRIGVGPLPAWWRREAMAARGPLWLPVAFAAGILVYFQADREPSLLAAALVAAALAAVAMLARARPAGFVLAVAAATVAAGFAAATLRTALIAHPVLTRPLVATVSGFVADRDQRERSDRVVLHVTAMAPAPEALPARLRIVLRPGSAPPVGAHVAVRARLNPLAGPVRPGSYDFGRDQWFAGLGGTGLAIGRVEAAAPPGALPWRIAAWRAVESVREGLGRRIRQVLPGDAGAIAAALVTGERDAIADTTNESLRISGLYHIISISGLHMAVIVGTVLVAVRGALALVPGLAARRPIKKWAAATALIAAGGYLVLSGAEVATTRAYLMAALVLAGVLADRVALSLRTLSFAALAVMVAMPESVLNPGFQMSFAATLALIAFYERWAVGRRDPAGGRLARLAWTVAGGAAALVLTALIAGAATAPFAAYHFHRLSPYSLVANLLATPVISAVVMPAALGAVLLLPFGFDRPLWLAMGWGIERTLDISALVAAWPGADGRLAAFGDGPLLLAAAALLLGVLPVSPLRLVALPAAGLAAALALGAPDKPDVLVDPAGRLVAVRGADGRLSVAGAASDRFVTRMWLAADGDRRSATDPSLAAGFACDAEGCVARLRDGAAVAVPATPAALEEDCARAALVVTALATPAPCAALRVDPARLAAGGALALTRSGAGWRVIAARDPARQRPWISRPTAPERAPPAAASPPPDDEMMSPAVD